MAVYLPIEPSTLVAGMRGNAAAWTVVQGNSDAMLEEYAPPLAIAQVNWSTVATSYVIHGRFTLPRNADNHDVRLRVWWKSAATANVRLSVGGDQAAASATPGSSGAISTVTVTPTGSGHPRTGTVEVHSSGGSSLEVFAIEIALIPSALTAAETTAGLVHVGTHWATADRAVPSEVVQRMMRNARAVAQDRPAALASAIYDAQGGQRDVDSDQFAVVDMATLGGTLDVRRLRCSIYLDAAGAGTPEARVQLGSWSETFTGTGWHHTTPELHIARGDRAAVSVRRSAGTGAVYLVAHQWMREHS